MKGALPPRCGAPHPSPSNKARNEPLQSQQQCHNGGCSEVAKQLRRKLQPAHRVRDSTNGSFAIIKDDLCGSGVDVNSGPAGYTSPDRPLPRTHPSGSNFLQRPVHNPQVTHTIYEAIGMRKEGLVELLISTGQQITKQKFICLELLRAVVTLLLTVKRLSLRALPLWVKGPNNLHPLCPSKQLGVPSDGSIQQCKL